MRSLLSLVVVGTYKRTLLNNLRSVRNHGLGALQLHSFNMIFISIENIYLSVSFVDIIESRSTAASVDNHSDFLELRNVLRAEATDQSDIADKSSLILR